MATGRPPTGERGHHDSIGRVNRTEGNWVKQARHSEKLLYLRAMGGMMQIPICPFIRNRTGEIWPAAARLERWGLPAIQKNKRRRRQSSIHHASHLIMRY